MQRDPRFIVQKYYDNCDINVPDNWSDLPASSDDSDFSLSCEDSDSTFDYDPAFDN